MTMQMRDLDLYAAWAPRASGLYVPPARKRDRPIAIDLFSGVGGMALGLIQGGFEVVAGADYDLDCMMTFLGNLGTYPCNLVFVTDADRERAEERLRESYRQAGWLNRRGEWSGDRLVDAQGHGPFTSGCWRPANRPGVGTYFLGDVRQLSGARILAELGLEPGEVDLVAGGPPCQGFSTAGKRDVLDPRNSLIFEYARLILEIQPKTMVMENVVGLLSMVTPEGVPVIDAFARVLSDGGFAGYDALKKSLLSSAGLGAALRSRGRPEPMPDEDDEDEPSDGPRQMSLLEAAS